MWKFYHATQRVLTMVVEPLRPADVTACQLRIYTKTMEDGRPRPSGLNLRCYLASEELPRPLNPAWLCHRYT